MAQINQEIFEIQQAIRNSTIGNQLSAIERWHKFRLQETTIDWIDLLGPTAVVLTHQEHFLQFTQLWVKNLEEPKLRQLLLASSVHDVGEAKLGDIASPDKTSLDEKNEVDFAIEAILSLPLDHLLIQELIVAYYEVIRGDNDSLHYIFKALERTEYLDTAIHLFDKLSQGKTMEKGWLMIARVLSFDFPKVLKYAEALPSIIGEYLNSHQNQINIMFEQSQAAVTPDFEANFLQNKSDWQKYLSLL